ncbi:MAG: hypothetical protein SNJ75_04500 [Gemmataceae bacterium]
MVMFCPSCGKSLPEDRDQVGARCPSCHDPLYEPATRIARPARSEEPVCAIHPKRESVGLCARCAEHVCETCRTRWRGQVLCMSCVRRALDTAEATPAMVQASRRQTQAALLFSLLAWLSCGLGLLLLHQASMGTAYSAPIMTLLGLIVIFAAVLPACIGAGQAVAALRGLADQPAWAWVGFGLGAGYAGLLLGLGIVGLWQP